MDKRFERSERYIRQAYLDLLDATSHDQISVSAICRKAGCSRNTFYLHYDSKDHLLSAIIEEVVADIEASCQPVVRYFHQIGPKESRQFTDQILKAVYENLHFIRPLLAQDEWQFSRHLTQVLLSSQIQSAQTLKQPYNHVHLVYFTNGVVGFIQFWLTTDWSLEQAQAALHEAIHLTFGN